MFKWLKRLFCLLDEWLMVEVLPMWFLNRRVDRAMRHQMRSLDELLPIMQYSMCWDRWDGWPSKGDLVVFPDSEILHSETTKCLVDGTSLIGSELFGFLFEDD